MQGPKDITWLPAGPRPLNVEEIGCMAPK
jgi:hypothetical protein